MDWRCVSFNSKGKWEESLVHNSSLSVTLIFHGRTARPSLSPLKFVDRLAFLTQITSYAPDTNTATHWELYLTLIYYEKLQTQISSYILESPFILASLGNMSQQNLPALTLYKVKRTTKTIQEKCRGYLMLSIIP